jgi:hypothetical protein
LFWTKKEPPAFAEGSFDTNNHKPKPDRPTGGVVTHISAKTRYHTAVAMSGNLKEIPMGVYVQGLQLVIAMISLVVQLLPFIK